MHLQVFSDLHADVRKTKPITVAPDIDAVVVAGDVCEGAERGFAWLRRIVPMHVPIIAVMGNHEFYHRTWRLEVAEAHRVAPHYGVHLLEDETVTINGVRFIGCSLWTDYRLFGEAKADLAMRRAREGLNDHRRITWMKKPWRRFRPKEALFLHQCSRTFLELTLAMPCDDPTVVVTHHAPHVGSLHPNYRDDLLSAAYVSDLSFVIENGQPDLWIHGHVHHSFDYQVGVTRMLCNPHGYGDENPAFDPALVVEVGR